MSKIAFPSTGAAVMAPLMVVLFISTLDQTIVAAAIQGLGKALGDSALAPWIATAYLLTSAVTTLIFGKLGDLYGRKLILQISVAIFTAASVLCALAPSMAWLIFLRGVQGIGGGGLSSLVMAIVAELVPGRQRARYQAVLGIVPVSAIILGPLLGGAILDYLSWHWIFLINAPICVVAFLSIAARLHLPHQAGMARQVDILGGLLCTVFSSALLLLASLGGSAWPWASWQIATLGTLGVAALLLYIRVEQRTAEAITPPRLFASSVFTISALLFFLASAVLFIGMLFAPLMLQAVFGMSALYAGASIIPMLVGLIVATGISGAAIARTGRYRHFLLLGALLSGSGLLALSRVSQDTPHALILLYLTVIGVGVGFFIQIVVLAGQNTVAVRDLGVATGTLNFFKTYGGATAGAVFGALLAARLPSSPDASPAALLPAYHDLFAWSVPLMVIAFALALRMRELPLSDTTIGISEGRIDVPEY